MATGIVDCVKIAIDVEHGNELTVNIDAPTATRFHVAGLTNLDEVSHSQDFLS
jgi:hypothetical protein